MNVTKEAVVKHQRKPRKHLYKGFEIRNFQEQYNLRYPSFHILEGEFSVNATTTLRSARALIDIWDESQRCACGNLHMPHDHRCKVCAEKGRTHESKLYGQRDRVA